ncbi:uncharacterized protein [Lolium perenne]|uniref:uncharacterized protein isoform X2 n=1 Tax=Lolium perenne TaxID=4522 RepID=UPI0021F5D9F6|nr:uncharacterized protein LOC127342322 isoform X2 [Lolium perenne]
MGPSRWALPTWAGAERPCGHIFDEQCCLRTKYIVKYLTAKANAYVNETHRCFQGAQHGVQPPQARGPGTMVQRTLHQGEDIRGVHNSLIIGGSAPNFYMRYFIRLKGWIEQKSAYLLELQDQVVF